MDSDSVVLLIRHSEKEKVENEFETPAELTEKGIEMAREFGRQFFPFKDRIASFNSSPIQRCMRTMEEIMSSLGMDIRIHQNNLLGDPGPFVIDDKEACKPYLENEPWNVVNLYLEGKDIPGHKMLEEGIEQMENELRSILESKKGIHICCSHDAIVAIYMGKASDTIYSKSNWIEYLDGILLR